MKLYTTSASPNGKRVNVFLAEKGIDIPRVEIDLRAGENLALDFRTRNPFGRVPVLELENGTCIAESVAICRYFDFEHAEPMLFGTTALEQAMVEMWNRRAELNFLLPVAQAFRHLTGYFKDREPVVPEWGQASEQVAREMLPLFDARLGESRHLAGDAFTIADITLAVGLAFARTTRRDLPYDLPNVSRWYERVSSRRSFAD
jgi:glutathione S-transferase